MRLLPALLVTCLALGCKPTARHHPAPAKAASSTTPAHAAASPARAENVAKVQRAVATVLNVAPGDVPVGVALNRLPKPVDDLDVVEIVLALEEQFHIEIPDEALARTAGGETAPALAMGLTVEKLTDLVESRLPAKR